MSVFNVGNDVFKFGTKPSIFRLHCGAWTGVISVTLFDMGGGGGGGASWYP